MIYIFILLISVLSMFSCENPDPVGPPVVAPEPPVIEFVVDDNEQHSRVIDYSVQGFGTLSGGTLSGGAMPGGTLSGGALSGGAMPGGAMNHNANPANGGKPFFSPSPELPDIDVDLSQGYNPEAVKPGQTLHLPASASLLTDLNMSTNTIYYIEGTLTLNSIRGQSAHIIVMPGGKLSLMTPNIPSGLTIYNYGLFELPSMVTLEKGAMLSTISNLSLTTLQVKGELYVGGDFVTIDFSASEGSVSKFDGCAKITGELAMENNSTIFVDKLLVCQRVIELKSQARISMSPRSVLSAEGLMVTDPLCRVECWGDDYAVLDLGHLTTKHSNVKSVFRGFLDIHFSTFSNQDGQEVEMLSQIKLNGTTHIPAAGCRPEIGTPPPTPTKEYVLNQVAEILPPTPESIATNVKNYGSVTFASWSSGQDLSPGGAIDIINFDSREITSTLVFPRANIFHMAVDEHGIWCAGGDKKGAFVCQAVFGSDFLPISDKLPRIALPGKAANCVLRCGASVVATSRDTGAFAVIDLLRGDIMSLKRVDNAKYAHLNGGTLITLTASEAPMVALYDAAVLNFNASPRSQFSVGPMDHQNINNMALVDGNTTYVSMGRDGLKAFTAGALKAHYPNAPTQGGLAQGLDLDHKFIYLANGKQGLVVLEKATLKPLAQYLFSAAQATSVTRGFDGLIYVTYGNRAIKVFTLIERTQR